MVEQLLTMPSFYWAEVMDKMPPVEVYWYWSIGLGIIGFLAAIWKRVLMLLVIPLVFLQCAGISDLDKSVGDSIRAEDPKYAQSMQASLVPVVALPILGGVIGLRRKRSVK